MRTCAIAISAVILAGCGTTPQPDIVYRVKEVPVEVPVMCPIDIPEVEGPDFAPADSNVEFAAVYVHGRIIALRQNDKELRAAIEACKQTVE